MIRKLTALTFGVSTVLAASSASAQSAAGDKAQAMEDASGWSIAGLLGFGFGGYNEFGLGVRGGYTLANHVYLGGTFIDYPGLASYYGNTFVTGFEGGYNIKAGPVIVRPYGGLGLIDVSYNFNGYAGYGCGTTVVNGVVVNSGNCGTSTTAFALWFGGTAIFPLTENWFVGGDLRFLINSVSGYYGASNFTAAIMGTGGYQF